MPPWLLAVLVIGDVLAGSWAVGYWISRQVDRTQEDRARRADALREEVKRKLVELQKHMRQR